MEAWEKRYLHNKAKRDSVLYMNNLPIPSNEEYGTLIPAPKECYLHYCGKLYWESMERLGHTSTVFSECICSKRGKI